MTIETLVLQPAPGARIAVDRLAGRPPAYVYLHGLGSVRAGEKSEALLAKARREGRAFARFDFRGHGSSSGTLEHTLLSDLIEDAETVLRAVGPSVVVGSSLGGLVAAWTAARLARSRPELVERLLLIAPAFGYVPRMRARADPLLLRLADGREFHLDQKYLDDAGHYDEVALARSLAMPVLVVHGEHDDVVPVSVSREFFERIPHRRKRLWVVPGGDHRLNREVGAIYDALDAFAREVP
jgi:pimeloyl-ACP methyl ester carboxylesterase